MSLRIDAGRTLALIGAAMTTAEHARSLSDVGEVEAGYPDGITLKVCAIPVIGYGTDITDIEREQMKPARVTLHVTVMTGSACLQTFNTKRIFAGWQGKTNMTTLYF